MSHYEFEGDTKDVSVRQLEFICSILDERGYKNGTVNIEPVGQAADNYVANVKRIIINKEEKPFKMIAKIAPSKEYQRKNMHTADLFMSEHIMYNEVLPKFVELEKEAEVPESERLRFATCYGTFMEEPDEIILLEDLNMSNFVMLDKFKSLTSETVKLVLRSFAILHSLSYALKSGDPETFELFSSKLFYMWERMNQLEEMHLYMKQLEDDVMSILDNEEYKNVIKNAVTQTFSRALYDREYYMKQKYSVIQQGDTWTNNIMFKLEDENVVECCMIDYQVSNKNSPVADIHYMIFNCTDYETRSKHYHEWIDYYYSELDKRLLNFGLNVTDIYPRDQFDADLMKQGKITIGQTIMIASMIMKEHHEAASFKANFETEIPMDQALMEMKLTAMESTTLTRFKNRVEGTIKSLVELRYL